MRIKQDFFIWDKFWKDEGAEIGLFRDSDFCPTPSPKGRGSFSARRMYHKSGMGSRGSAMVLDKDGVLPHESRADTWRFAPEDPAFRERVLETVAKGDRRVESHWVKCRPVPYTEAWFETKWRAFRNGEIYNP